jgi:arsenate reductase
MARCTHWSYPDPSAAPEAEQAQRFALTREAIAYRMLQLVQLPFTALDNQTLHAQVQAIGAS